MQLFTIRFAAAIGAVICGLSAIAQKALPHRVFAGSRLDYDRMLARPYDADVPFGSAGDRVWATSPQGWGFHDGVQLVYMTNLDAFDLVVVGGGRNYVVGKADYAPSHIHMAGAPGTSLLAAATASFTYTTDRPENPLTKPFKPEKRWTCWSSGRREDWYAIGLDCRHRMTGVDLYFFSDVDEGGGCAAPEAVRLELYRDGAWHSAPILPIAPHAGMNTITLVGGAQPAERMRFTFRNRGANLYTGLYGADPHFAAGDCGPQKAGGAFKVAGDKWITQNDVLVSRITAHNAGANTQSFFVRMESGLSGTQDGFADEHTVEGFPLYLTAGGSDGHTRAASFITELRPGESRTFTFACAVASTRADAAYRLDKLLATPDPLRAQVAAYQGWYDENTAYFTCSDPLVAKMYAHRYYNLRKNSMDPRLGALKYRTFSEGRWTSDWYANVISYGAGHQVREARWLRDPSYAWGHLQTWTDNERPDGIYPSHITPKGQQGGQYTDWITSTAWDTYLVHPDRPALAKMADALARNAEGWRTVYGWNGNPLLVVDSHWWTGMEWQPSFFSFSGYRTGGGAGIDPTKMTALRRVDLTAYNFGNEQAVARIYGELGRTNDAAAFQALADSTRDAVVKEMWDPQTHWFHSLRATDDVKSPTKEIIGLYPFYFELPPAGKGYESEWSVAVDPAQFWTAWPLASVSLECPAYSQTGWPVGPGGSGCMWNGPTWPHANSIVMTAMANTLRHYAPCALTRQKLLDLFLSFTGAQYRDQNPKYPWTGEFYNGDTGAWKTPQRDYNHSTWIDPLISDLIGLVPRNDDILEIDPLLPDGAWSYWVLDGQAYRGHDVTVAFDAEGTHTTSHVKGFSVYLDGKPVYHAERPAHVMVNMSTRRLIRETAAAGGKQENRLAIVNHTAGQSGGYRGR